MLTREELLEKGVSEDAVDEILSAFEDSGSQNSLELLEKALDGDNSQSLFKADDEPGDDDGEEDYNEEYMKKYMKKYMKENKSACTKAAKEAGLFGDEMKKAVDNFDTDAAGAVVEMADLAPVLDIFSDTIQAMAKAIEEISGQVVLIGRQNEQSFDVMQKAARVQVEQAKALDTVFSQPQGRKGAVVADVAMQKAVPTPAISEETKKYAYTVLMKAVKNGDRKAGDVISTYESCGQDVSLLSNEQRQYINDLITQEAN